MRKKEILALIVYKIIPNKFHSWIISWFRSDLIVLAYHRVLDIDNELSYPYDQELISATVKQFDYQMKHIKKNYNPISEEQLIDSIENGTKLPERPVMITFDDGFVDNYTNAYPILKKYNIPATIFITSGYMGTNKTLWFDWLASLVFSSHAKMIDIPILGKHYIRGDRQVNANIMVDLIINLRKVDNQKRIDVLEYLNTRYNDDMKDIDVSLSRVLNWDQIKVMSDNNISIGSHSVTHPILSRLNEVDLNYELNESKNQIEAKLGKPVYSIAYPTGMKDSFTDNIVNLVKESGYKIAYTYIHDTNRLPIVDSYRLKRLHIEANISQSYFNMMLNYPKIFRN